MSTKQYTKSNSARKNYRYSDQITISGGGGGGVTPTTHISSLDYFIVGGGGGSGGSGTAGTSLTTSPCSGAGGAGGLLFGTVTSITAGTTITLTVGAGGNSGAGANTQGNNGGDSSISGTGFATVTALGGGGGGSGSSTATKNGKTGGSGGGSSGNSSSGSSGGGGTAGQGNAGGGVPAIGTNTNLGGGGGGGASGAGGSGYGSATAALPVISGSGAAGIIAPVPWVPQYQIFAAGGGGSNPADFSGGLTIRAKGQGPLTAGQGLESQNTQTTAAFVASNAMTNSGSGGGGLTRNTTATGGVYGKGGSGIVYIRATINDGTTTYIAPTATGAASNTQYQANGQTYLVYSFLTTGSMVL